MNIGIRPAEVNFRLRGCKPRNEYERWRAINLYFNNYTVTYDYFFCKKNYIINLYFKNKPVVIKL